MSAVIKLDVRDLAPPEPFEIILSALYKLDHGAILQVHIHREPFPLYDFLKNSGFNWRTCKVAFNDYRISIKRLASRQSR